MKNIYTYSAVPAKRIVTVDCMRKAKKEGRKLTQVTAYTPDEARAAEEAKIEMMVVNASSAGEMRQHNNTTFTTAAIKMTEHATTDDILREACRVLHLGIDAVITPRSPHVIEALAREGFPVMGHLGLVPRKTIITGGLKAAGKTSDEALDLLREFKRLESAGAFAVESEVICGESLAEIAKRTSLICISLGSGNGGDVDFLFQSDIVGEDENPPRHVQKFGDLAKMYRDIYAARVAALNAFRDASASGAFPTPEITPNMAPGEYEKFLAEVDRIQEL